MPRLRVAHGSACRNPVAPCLVEHAAEFAVHVLPGDRLRFAGAHVLQSALGLGKPRCLELCFLPTVTDAVREDRCELGALRIG